MCTKLLQPLLLLLIVLLYSLCVVHALSFNVSDIKSAEFCERQTFAADCKDKEGDKVVVMVSARYGRMRTSRCLSGGAGGGGGGGGGLSESNCELDVIDQFDSRCSGRRSCEVRVSSIIDGIRDHQMSACLREFRGSLDASYACVPVISRTAAECTGRSKTSVRLDETTGFLANVVTDESGCGSVENPWILEAPEGRTIHLRLIDFAFSEYDLVSQRGNCDVYLVIKDKPFSVGTTICSIDKKEQNIYLSESNRIEVRIVAGSFQRQNVGSKYFLLKYTLQGCADIKAENGRWVERLGSISVVGCNGSNEKFQLTCQANAWVGELKKCSTSFWSGNAASMFWSVFTDSQWIAIATILGIALIIGVMIFLAGIICIRRRRQVRSIVGRVCSSPRCMAEYHVTRCPNDPSVISGRGSATPKSLSLDLLGGSSLDGSNAENDYFRTWQLQRNAFNNLRCHNIPGVADVALYNASVVAFKAALNNRLEREFVTDDFGRQTLPLVEHIYESPKFDRKDYNTIDPACPASTAQREETFQPHEAAVLDDCTEVSQKS